MIDLRNLGGRTICAAIIVSTLIAGNSASAKLRNQPPSLGKEEPYYLGSGRVGGGGDTNGKWDYLIGPVYTSPNFLTSEDLEISERGKPPIPIKPKMYRRPGAGVFAGSVEADGLEIAIFEHTYRNQPWVARTIQIRNLRLRHRNISITASLVKSPKVTSAVANPDSITLFVKKGTPWGWVAGAVDRWAEIAFNTSSKALSVGEIVKVTTTLSLPAGGKAETTLYHLLHFDEGQPSAAYAKAIRNRDPQYDYRVALAEWRMWQFVGARLELPDERIKRIIEGTAVLTRMQQSSDGGFIAGTRIFDMSYGRDSHGASRGALAAGHPEMVREYLDYLNKMFSQHHQIANAAEMGTQKPVEMVFPHPFAETPGYAALVLGHYYRTTGDLEFAKKHAGLLEHAVGVQLDYAKTHEWVLPFHGDETEWWPCGGPVGRAEQVKLASLNSTLVFLKSLEVYATYLNDIGQKAQAKQYQGYSVKVRQAILTHFRDPVRQMLDWTSPVAPYKINNFLMSPYYLNASIDETLQRNSLMYVLSQKRADASYPMIDSPNIASPSDTFSGHTLALALSAMAVVDHPQADSVLNKILDGGIVSTWGTVSEYYYPDGTTNTHNMRAWESNVNAEAILAYIFGLRVNKPTARLTLHPHLPTGWKYARVSNVPYGSSRIDVGVDQPPGKWRVKLKTPASLTLDFTLRLGNKPKGVMVNGKRAQYSTKPHPLGNGWIITLSSPIPAGKSVLEVLGR